MNGFRHNPSIQLPSRPTLRHRGFTLVEILIVVVILGILATIVIPQFSNASHQTRENTLKDELRYLRLQIQVFKAQHRDKPPGYVGGDMSTVPTEAELLAQLIKYTDERCNSSATMTATIKFGPYLSRFPPNPITDQSSVYIVQNNQPMPQISDLPLTNGGVAYGWIFKPQTQELMANLAGSDTSGTPYASY